MANATLRLLLGLAGATLLLPMNAAFAGACLEDVQHYRNVVESPASPCAQYCAGCRPPQCHNPQCEKYGGLGETAQHVAACLEEALSCYPIFVMNQSHWLLHDSVDLTAKRVADLRAIRDDPTQRRWVEQYVAPLLRRYRQQPSLACYAAYQLAPYQRGVVSDVRRFCGTDILYANALILAADPTGIEYFLRKLRTTHQATQTRYKNALFLLLADMSDGPARLRHALQDPANRSVRSLLLQVTARLQQVLR